MRYTRQQYMDKECTHHQYYSQFVTQATKDFVIREFGMKKLNASKCEHLNDLCKHTTGTNGGRWTWDYSPMNESLAKELGANRSPATYTCVGKAAARILMEEQVETV